MQLPIIGRNTVGKHARKGNNHNNPILILGRIHSDAAFLFVYNQQNYMVEHRNIDK